MVWASWIIADLDYRAFGIDDAEIDYGIDLDRDVIARDHVLGRHLVDHHAQVDAHHLLNERHEQKETRPLGAGVAPEREHDAALVFAQDAHGRIKHGENKDNNDDSSGGGDHGGSSLR